MMAIITMQPWHLISVAIHMRREERDEFALLGSDEDPQRWACRRALEPGMHFAALDRKGIPVACFGFLDGADPQMATIWLCATERWRSRLKDMRKTYDAVANAGIYRQFFSTIPETTGAPGRRRFLEWLGLTYRGTLPSYFATGEGAQQFSRVLTLHDEVRQAA